MPKPTTDAVEIMRRIKANQVDVDAVTWDLTNDAVDRVVEYFETEEVQRKSNEALLRFARKTYEALIELRNAR